MTALSLFGGVALLASGAVGVPDVPDLELSFRRTLSTNETFRCSIVNRSEAPAEVNAYFVSLRWKDETGRIVADFGPAELGAAACSALSFSKRAAAFGTGRFLKPELVVTGAGKTSVFRDGFEPVRLTAEPGADFEWVRTALCEQATGVSSTVTVGQTAEDGTRRVTGRVSGAVAFESLEAVEDGEVVYRAAAPAAEPGSCGLRLSLTRGTRGSRMLNGFIGINNVKDLACRPITLPRAQQKLGGWVFRGAELADCESFATFAAEVPETAEIVVALKDMLNRRIPVRDLLAKGSVCLEGPDGATLCFERWLKPMSGAVPSLKTTAVDVDFLWRPRTSDAVLILQARDIGGRVWKSLLRSSDALR